MDKIKNEKGCPHSGGINCVSDYVFILMFLFVVGNAYVQKCRIEEIVVSLNPGRSRALCRSIT